MRSMKAKELLRFITAQGFFIIRTNSSHKFMGHSDGRKFCWSFGVGEEIGKPMVSRILRQCGIERNTFDNW
jgi:predicted RNA binding protein YcfA (HicA-like mRNA interferase family)